MAEAGIEEGGWGDTDAVENKSEEEIHKDILNIPFDEYGKEFIQKIIASNNKFSIFCDLVMMVLN